MDEKINPEPKEHDTFNVLKDKISNIFKEHLPGANENEGTIFEETEDKE